LLLRHAGCAELMERWPQRFDIAIITSRIRFVILPSCELFVITADCLFDDLYIINLPGLLRSSSGVV